MAFLFKSKKNASGLPSSSRKLASADGHHPPVELSQEAGDNPKIPMPMIGSQPRGVYSPTPELRNPRERSESGMSTQGRSHRQQHDLSLYPWSQHRLNFRQNGANPFPRYGAATNAIASLEGDVFLMGGLINGSTVKGDLWMVEAGSSNLDCYQVATQAEGPGPRVGHASLLVGNAFIIFGGDTKVEDHDVLDDTLYLLNTTTKQWTQAAPAGPRPSGRYGHTINIIGTKIYVFGGQVEGYFFNDLVAFDLNALQSQTARWEVLIQNSGEGVSPNGPPARTNHTVITWNEKLYLFGGTDGVNWFNDVWMYDPKVNYWTPQECNGFIPSAREGHAAALVGDHMYIFGGRTEEGKDLGDLAAFRIPTRRWFTFQNMGPSPSPRSGHGMTAFGNQIVILAGEPSSAPSDPKELSLTYILDTTKIRYPAEHGPQKSINSRKTSIGERTQTPERSASQEGQTSNGGRKLSARGSEDSMSSVSQPQQQLSRGVESVPISNAYTSQTQRAPRTSTAPGVPGPPPQEAAPQPRMNGMKPPYIGSDGRDSPKLQQKVDRVLSPEQAPAARESNILGKNSDTREGAFQTQPIHNQLDGTRDPFQQGNFTAALAQQSPGNTSKTTSNEEPLRSSSQRSQRQQSSTDSTARNAGRLNEVIAKQSSQDTNSQSSAPRQVPIDSGFGSSPALGRHNEELLKEIESVRSKNAWYASELALARKAGYRSSTTENSFSDDKTANAFGDEERPMLEALIRMKTELEKVQEALETQSTAAAQTISLVEKQRDAAVAEAVYAKTRLAARDGKSMVNEDDGRGTASPEQERSEGVQRRLASALTAQNELTSRLRQLTKELEYERKTRQVAEESAEVAHSRAVELDLHKQESTSELERLRSELSQAKTSNRELATNHADVLSASQILEVEKKELSEKLSSFENDTHSNGRILDSLREAVSSSTSRASMLERRLDEERQERALIDNKLVKLRQEHEAQSAELNSTAMQLQDAKVLVETYKSEADSHREAVLAGLGRTNNWDPSKTNDERVIVLQQQLEAANVLVRRNQEAADQATDRLRRAEERIAGLEAYQEQASREGLNMRKQLQTASREVLSLQSNNTELSNELSKIQQSTAAIEVQHSALRDLLNEHGVDTDNIPSEMDVKNHELLKERTRDLEQQLESSMKSHEDLRNSFEAREREANKGWEERLAALDNDYQSAVKYFKVAERMVTKMKHESVKYKAQIKELEETLSQERAIKSNAPTAPPDWAKERDTLKDELRDMQTRVDEATEKLERQMEDLRVAQSERDETRDLRARFEQELSRAIEENRSNTEHFRQQSNLLEARAIEAERKVQVLLDTVGTTVSNYRRESQILSSGAEHISQPHDHKHQRVASTNSIGENSVYDAASDHTQDDRPAAELGRNSVALDSLASELDALRTHWETTSKNYRLSDKSTLDEKSSASDGLANWRKKLELEEDHEEGR